MSRCLVFGEAAGPISPTVHFQTRCNLVQNYMRKGQFRYALVEDHDIKGDLVYALVATSSRDGEQVYGIIPNDIHPQSAPIFICTKRVESWASTVYATLKAI